MKFPILTAVLVLCLVIALANKRSKEYLAEEEDKFWERENAANSTRRKSLDSLKLITIPLDILPMDNYKDNNIIQSCIDTIVELSKSPIANLTGISNTDLKLKYGAPNIDLLATYDSRYTTLASTLNKLGQALYDEGDIQTAKEILEFAVSTNTDISGTYRLLGDIYQSEGNAEGISGLIQTVNALNTPMKPSIITYLESLS